MAQGQIRPYVGMKSANRVPYSLNSLRTANKGEAEGALQVNGHGTAHFTRRHDSEIWKPSCSETDVSISTRACRRTFASSTVEILCATLFVGVDLGNDTLSDNIPDP